MRKNKEPAVDRTSSKFIESNITMISQQIALNRTSCILQINHRGEKGKIIFRKGEIIDARFRELSAGQAVKALFDLQLCEIQLFPDNEQRPGTITLSVSSLLNNTISTEDVHGVDTTDVGSFEMEKKETIRGQYLQSAEAISGFVWGSMINMKGEILKISSMDFISEAYAYASILENLEDAKADCLANIEIGPPATVQLRTKKGAAFYAYCGELDEYFLTFFTLDAPVETLPIAIYQIIQG
jgi:hypothetical protein